MERFSLRHEHRDTCDFVVLLVPACLPARSKVWSAARLLVTNG